MRRLVTAALIAVVAAAALASCADDSGGGGGSSTADLAAASDETWIVDLLSLVPDDGFNGAQVIANDYLLARSGSGVERPGDEATGEELASYRLAMTTEPGGPGTAPPLILGIETPESDTAAENEIGFAFEDVDRDIAAGVAPDTLEIVQGSIDPEAVAEAVTSDPTWSDVLQRGEAGGVEYYSWLDDGELDIERRSPLRPVGGSLRLAPVDASVVITRTTTQMEAVLAGDGPTLADHDEFASVAAVLQDEGTHSVFLTDAPLSATGGVSGSTDTTGSGTDGAPAAAGDVDRLDRPAVLGMGGGYRNGEPIVVEVLAYGDEATAEVNADRLEALAGDGESEIRAVPWSDLLTVESVDVIDGQVVAVFATEQPTLWLDIVLQSDNLVTVG